MTDSFSESCAESEQKLNHFKSNGLLGQGAEAEVHSVTVKGKLYALKVFNQTQPNSNFFYAKSPIVKEYEILSKLKEEKNIV